MRFDRPDPRFTASKRAQRNFALALKISLWVVAALWFITLADQWLQLDLARFGLRPGRLSGLIGVVTAPLLHADFEHLFANTLPLAISLTAVLYLYPNSGSRVIPVIWLGSGVLAWIIGRPSLHFGASGLVYGLLAYVFFGGVLRNDMRSIAVSLMVGFLYGSMIWGVLPIRPNMSWELHLSGAVLGALLAWWYRRWDRPPVVRYSWEDDDRVPDWYPGEHDDEDDTRPGGGPRAPRDGPS